MEHTELPPFEYDIALSFAGEDRNYVCRVAENLRSVGARVFYDEFELVNMWGKNLYVYLDEIYRNKARYCVVFLSKNYAKKVWTNHERESAQARAFLSNQEYILPARFDSTEIPGVLPTVAYVDLAKLTSEEFTEVILKKIGKLTGDRSILSTIESRQSQKHPFFVELASKHYMIMILMTLFVLALGLFAVRFLNNGEEYFQHTISKTQDGKGGTSAQGTPSSPTTITETQDSRGTSAQDTPIAPLTIKKTRDGVAEPIPTLRGTH